MSLPGPVVPMIVQKRRPSGDRYSSTYLSKKKEKKVQLSTWRHVILAANSLFVVVGDAICQACMPRGDVANSVGLIILT
jgi:hypothetical protein